VGPAWQREKGERRGAALVGLRGETGPRVGRRWSGPAGLGWGLLFFFFLFFSNPFQTNFKPFQIQIFYMFSNSNFNTNFSNYFKGFSQTIFNNFSNIF
jgi:hypothetical protein